MRILTIVAILVVGIAVSAASCFDDTVKQGAKLEAFLRPVGTSLDNLAIPISAIERTRADQTAASLARHVDGMTSEDGWAVIAYACLSKDLLATANEKSVEDAFANIGGSVSPSPAVRARALGQELDKATDLGDRASKLGAYALCEAADAQS
ncbi:hypothetical protein MPY17_13950 [Rhodococcus opacus]|uniref:hypothetical protein n=1 Tax=Rhodococcus opacus TaxID=37919 RepID=UPI001FF613EE|nr:hypothetical protein [Rhodococcus opacus]UOT06772.1 hypothetical protein MPY17_13950 [Rhodococcus opacus]